VIAYIIDIFNARTETSFTLNVLKDSQLNVSAVLANSTSKNLESGNVNGFMQTINVVSSTVGTVNCASALDCVVFNRDECFLTTNTFGKCFSGFKGVMGDSNTICFDLNSSTREIGSFCSSNVDCFFSYALILLVLALPPLRLASQAYQILYALVMELVHLSEHLEILCKIVLLSTHIALPNVLVTQAMVLWIVL
jgi:hypothetical protein